MESGLKVCTRVDEAWQVGTMTEADFLNADDDMDTIHNVEALIRELIEIL